MNLSFSTYYEQLLYEVGALKRISREPEFSAYLDSVSSRAATAPAASLELRREMIQNYMIYANRRRAVGEQVPASFMEAVYPGMEAPFVAQQAEKPQSMPQSMPQPQVVQTQSRMQPQVAQPQPQMVQSQPQPQVVQSQPQMQVQQPQMTQAQPQMQPQMMQQPSPFAQPVQPEQPPKPKAEKKPGAEYAVGGIVLSVLGTVLILTGFIMLAVNFFESFWQGMCLYGVCVSLIVISELLIRRLVKKLSYVFTSLGIAGFFVVTLVNYYALGLFNFWVTMILLLVFTALTVAFARFKKALLFNLIGYASVFVNIGLVGSIESEAQLYTLFGVVLLESVLWIAFPVSDFAYIFSIIQTVGSLVFMFSLASWTPVAQEQLLNETQVDIVRTIFIAANFIVLLIGTTLAGFRLYSDAPVKTDSEGNLLPAKKHNPIAVYILFLTSSFFHMLLNAYYYNDVVDNLGVNMSATFSVLAILICGTAAIFFLRKKNCTLWTAVLFASSLIMMTWLQCIIEKAFTVVGMVIIVLAVAACARFLKDYVFKILDIILKVWIAVSGIIIAHDNGNSAANYILIAGLVLIIAIGSGFLVPSEIVLTGALIFCVCQVATYKLWLMLISGIVMLAVFVFHNVKWLKHKYILVFDIFALVTTVFVLGFLNHPFYKEDMITILIVFCFGLGILVQYLQKSYGMFFAGNMMPIALYLSYFVLVLRLKDAFVTSAILMGVALVCVTLGFLMKQRAIRIYGLVLSMLVCIKLVFFDFAGAASLVKTIMYFVVGIIALGISGVYIVMEMHLQKRSQVQNKIDNSDKKP